MVCDDCILDPKPEYIHIYIYIYMYTCCPCSFVCNVQLPMYSLDLPISLQRDP